MAAHSVFCHIDVEDWEEIIIHFRNKNLVISMVK